MMRFLNALEQAKWHIKTLWGVLLLSFALNVFLGLGWHLSESKIKVEVPPVIPESGLTITQGQVPKATVYSFAYYIWQSLNHWPKNGLDDYKAQINKYSPFLTPTFQSFLVKDYNDLLDAGELQDRLRVMQGMSGEAYQPVDVKYVGHGTWLVRLNMRLTERMQNVSNKAVKDVDVAYTLRVVKYDVDANSNPWGLALDGFVTSPTRIKTLI